MVSEIERPTWESLEISAGVDGNAFRAYHRQCGWVDKIDPTEKLITARDRAGALVCRAGATIVGHAVWHESNTDVHTPGLPRDSEDTKALERLLAGKGTFFELHEYWVISGCRGQGLGGQLLSSVERLALERSYRAVVCYALHPTAVALFRRRGYREAWLQVDQEWLFCSHLAK